MNAAVEKVIHVKLADLRPSPFNPRKHLGDLAELAASIKQVGVLEPAVIRNVAHAFELVFGHRRHAAAKLAGVETLPCIVREYSDDDVIEVQIVENSQRADVHPLDEADGFKVLIDRGRTIAAIADKVGRSSTYITQRLQLCQLGKGGRDALDDKLTIGAAIALARVPSSLQGEALEALASERWGADKSAAVSSAHARKVIEERFMLRLKQAPWPLDDDRLVPKAGACSHCPKRTGNQVELFADVKSPDLCIDPTCYRSKLDATWALRKKDKGPNAPRLLEGKDAEKALSYSGGFKKLDDEIWTGSKHVKVSTLAKQLKAPIVLARDKRTGAHVELVKEDEIRKAVSAHAPKGSSSAPNSYALAERKRAAAQKRQRRVVELAIAAAVTATEQASRGEAESLTIAVVRAFAARAWNEHQKAVLARREVATDKRKHGFGNDVEGALLKHIDTLNAKQVLGLGVELALLVSSPGSPYAGGSRWKPTLMALGVNLAKIEKQVTAEEAARKKAKKAKRAPATKAAAKVVRAKDAVKGVCSECGCTHTTPCDDGMGPCSWVNKQQTLCSACA